MVTWDIDPFAEAVLLDPYPYYSELHARGPAVWLDRYGIWAIGRFEPVQTVFRDWERFCSSRGVGLTDFKKEKPWRQPSIILEVDPPEHRRTRSVMTHAMSPRAISSLRQAAESEAERVVSEILDKRQIDAVTELAERFTVKVFADAVGLTSDNRDHLLRYGEMVFNSLGPDNEVHQRSMLGADKVGAWIAEQCRREKLAPKGLGAALYAAADDGQISESEAALLVRSLLSAGVDTTVSGIGNAIHSFAQYPDQWRLLSEDPGLTRQAFEEVLRYESPVHSFFRTTTCDTTLEGVKLGEGEKIVGVLAAANRDPLRWENPDAFDIRRKPLGHVAFGTGIHSCVGAAIARQESEVLLSALARRVSRLEPAGEPEWRPGNSLRALARLPLEVHPK